MCWCPAAGTRALKSSTLEVQITHYCLYEVFLHKTTNPGPFSLPKSPDVLQIWPVIHHLICLNRSASHTLKTSNWFMYSLSSAEDACLSSHTLFLSRSLYLAMLIPLLLLPPYLPLSLVLPCAHEATLCFCLVSCFSIRGGDIMSHVSEDTVDNRLLLQT